MPEGSFGTGQGAGRFVLSDRNPNPLEGCACSPGARHEDSGPPFAVFTASVPATRNEHNFVVCAGCVLQCGKKILQEDDLLGLGGGTPPAEVPEDIADYVPNEEDGTLPPPHVNPVGDSYEEVERELDARDDGPVI